MTDLVLEDDQMCFACGSKNPVGLKLKFSLAEDNTLRTEFTPQKAHQGYKDIVHGGIIALILDEAMVNLLWKLGKPAISAEIQVKLSQPVKVGETIYFEAHITKDGRKVIYTQAVAMIQNHTLVASATAKCVELDNAARKM